MTISDLRRIIDELDEQILHLLNERALAARQIGLLKKNLGLPVYDPEREEAVLAAKVAQNAGPLHGEQIRAIFEKIIAGCRELQG